MRMSLPSESSGPAHTYFEVPFDWPIEVEGIQEVPLSRELFYPFIIHLTPYAMNIITGIVQLNSQYLILPI